MAEPVGALRVDVTANAAQIHDDLRRVTSIVNSAAAQMQKSFAALGKGANAAIGAVFNLRNAAMALATGAMITFVKNSVKVAAEIDDTSKKLGITAESYQELSYAAKLAGVEQEDFSKAMDAFAKRLGEVKVGGSAVEGTLAKLGLSLADLRGKSPDEALRIVADRVKGLQDPMQRASVLSELFGRSGIKMGLMLMEGSAGMKAMANEARRLGFILSDETIKKAAEADDEFDRIGQALKVAGVNISAGFLPALTSIRELVTSQEFQDGVKNLAANFGELIKWMVDNKETIVTVATALTGMKLGAALGSGFGRQGAVIGAVTGGLAGLVAGAELSKTKLEELEQQLASLQKKAQGHRDMLAVPSNPEANGWLRDELVKTEAEIDKVRAKIQELKTASSQPLQVTVNRSGGDIVDPQMLAEIEAVNKAIEGLKFRTQIARGEFGALAEGFPQAAHGLKVFGQAGAEARVSIEQLPEHLRRLNLEQAKFNAARLTEEMLTPWEKFAQEVEKLNTLFATGTLAQETYNRKLFTLREELTRATGIGIDFRGMSKDMGDTLAGAFEDAITRAKSFQDILKALIADIAKLMIRRAVTDPLSGLISSGLNNVFSGLGGGGGAGGPMNILPVTGGAGGGYIPSMPTFGGLYADGGTLRAGQWGIAGEEGPEPIFAGSMPLSVIPNAGERGGSITVNVHNAPAGTTANARSSRDASGGTRIDVVLQRAIDETGAALIASGESAMNRSFEQRYGLTARL